VQWYELKKNGILTSSFTSQEVRTVGIFEISFTTTEIWEHLYRKSYKFGEIALLEKIKLDFSNIYHSYILK
jgi:hypothetical protein